MEKEVFPPAPNVKSVLRSFWEFTIMKIKCLFAASFLLTILQFNFLPNSASAADPPTNIGMVMTLDGSDWLLGTDPDNKGKLQKWWDKPQANARPTKVPWVIQEIFPYYYGLVWYWKDFTAPANPHPKGRYLMKFVYVDYQADVWVNGVYAGSHETGDGSFLLDVTDGVKPDRTNRLAVPVLNPRYEPIDEITLNETPHRNRGYPMRLGCDANNGGIEGSVELLIVPAVYISDIFVVPADFSRQLQRLGYSDEK